MKISNYTYIFSTKLNRRVLKEFYEFEKEKYCHKYYNGIKCSLIQVLLFTETLQHIIAIDIVQGDTMNIDALQIMHTNIFQH